MAKLTKRALLIQESATLKLNERVKSLQAQGVPILNLTAGEPDAPVPEAIQKAAIQAIQDGKNKYTPVAGIPSLRAAISNRYGAGSPSSGVVVTNGAKQAIYQALLATLEPGDEALFSSPYWLSYPEMVKLAGGKPRAIKTGPRERYLLTASLLKKNLSSRTRVVILNSPANPSGSVYFRAELRAIAEFLMIQKKVWIIADEIYESLVFSSMRSEAVSLWEVAPELRNRTIIASGLSKSDSLTGWRVGWSYSEPSVAERLAAIQGQMTSGVNSVAQWASLAAFEPKAQYREAQRKRYESARNLVWGYFKNLVESGTIKGVMPEGAFYFWWDVGSVMRRRKFQSSVAFAERILEDISVAVVPGGAFGDDRCIRISFATDSETIKEGARRLAEYLMR